MVLGFRCAKNIGIYSASCSETVKKCENTTYFTIFRGPQKMRKSDVLLQEQEEEQQEQAQEQEQEQQDEQEQAQEQEQEKT